ncbi:MAG TPA: hypothetical protein PLM70_05615, partial [Bacteroidales bacterium]|nr:hypothetical protein [Bacteroidales bacterium]
MRKNQLLLIILLVALLFSSCSTKKEQEVKHLNDLKESQFADQNEPKLRDGSNLATATVGAMTGTTG